MLLIKGGIVYTFINSDRENETMEVCNLDYFKLAIFREKIATITLATT